MGMVKVHSPNDRHSGVTAGVRFVRGVAEVDEADRGALSYFERHGYEVGDAAPKGDGLAGMKRAELDAMATELGIEDVGQLSNKAAVIDAIREAEADAS